MSDWGKRAARAVAGFTSTRSKGPDAMFGGPEGPTHMTRAQGCIVTTSDERELIDWTMALGAVSLGYAHAGVTEAVLRAARDGAVGPLPPELEVRVAERLAAVYPGAGQARFFKTGAEAVAAAVRVARAITDRAAIVHCGYHGWLDGPTSGPGVPEAVSSLWHAIPFNDMEAIREAVRTHDPAAVIIEPVVEHAPSREWMEALREVTSDAGVALIFDEVKTAFRLRRGGAAEVWGIEPDLAVVGKALANGYPLAALLGRPELLARLRQTWVSSTLATEFVSLAAADAVLDAWEEQDIAMHIQHIGIAMMSGVAERLPDGCEILGAPAMWFLRFADTERERRFLLACVQHGVLMKRGAYNFPCLAHTDREVQLSLEAIGTAFKASAP